MTQSAITRLILQITVLSYKLILKSWLQCFYYLKLSINTLDISTSYGQPGWFRPWGDLAFQYKIQSSPQFSKIDHACLLTLIQVDIFLDLFVLWRYCHVGLCECLASRWQDASLNRRATSVGLNHLDNVLFTSYFMHLYWVLCRCYSMHLVEYEILYKRIICL